MKTMTCRLMGGPCDFAVKGETADEIIQKGAAHVEEMAAQGDAAHIEVKKMMDEMQKNPDSGKEWFAAFQKNFALLEDK